MAVITIAPAITPPTIPPTGTDVDVDVDVGIWVPEGVVDDADEAELLLAPVDGVCDEAEPELTVDVAPTDGGKVEDVAPDEAGAPVGPTPITTRLKINYTLYYTFTWKGHWKEGQSPPGYM